MTPPPNLTIITNELTQHTKSILGDKLRKIILYGSYARGDYSEYSDLDIMVLASFDESEESQLQKSINILSSRASLEHDVTVCMLLNDEHLFASRLPISPFYRNVVSEGVELYAAR